MHNGNKLCSDVTFFTDLKDSQREGMRELFFVENESMSGPTVHVHTGQGVYFGIHPVQALVDEV